MKKLTIVLGVLGIAPLAHASIQLSYSLTTPAAATPCATVVSGSPNVAAACFTPLPAGPGPTDVGNGVIINTFSSEGIQTVGNSQQLSATTSIRNTSASSQILTLWAVIQNFTSPTAPPPINWSSNLQFTSTTGTGTITMMSCLDTANGLAAPSPFCSGAGSPTLTNNVLAWNGVTTPPPDTVSRSVTTLGSPYSMGEKITITLGAGSTINFNTSQILTQVPEPTAVALFGGMLLFTGAAIRRKASRKV